MYLDAILRLPFCGCQQIQMWLQLLTDAGPSHQGRLATVDAFALERVVVFTIEFVTCMRWVGSFDGSISGRQHIDGFIGCSTRAIYLN